MVIIKVIVVVLVMIMVIVMVVTMFMIMIKVIVIVILIVIVIITCLVQATLGIGLPCALHSKVIVDPARTTNLPLDGWACPDYQDDGYQKDGDLTWTEGGTRTSRV